MVAVVAVVRPGGFDFAAAVKKCKRCQLLALKQKRETTAPRFDNDDVCV